MVQKGGSSMNLPRNIVQIGEPDKHHKIFIEDYVLSHIKQSVKQNREKLNTYGLKEQKMVLYGEMQEENEVTYYFLYAAALLTCMSEQDNYLSQEERNEIEELRLRFFPDYQCRAFCTLGEELPDGFFIREGWKGRFVGGYACFYEKNDSMLSYMLYKKESARPVKEEVKTEENQNQEEFLKKVAIKQRAVPVKSSKKEPVVKSAATTLRLGAMWVIIVLCIIGITAINDADKLKGWKDAVVKGFESINEQKLPDKEVVSLKDETEEAGSESVLPDVSQAQIQHMISENMIVIDADKQPDENPTLPEQTEPVREEAPAEVTEPEDIPAQGILDTPETEKEPETYVIARGDTLLSISREKYGTVEMVKAICELNQIANPDSIQIGQTILLP